MATNYPSVIFDPGDKWLRHGWDWWLPAIHQLFLIMGINGCATGLALHKYIVEMEWLQSTGTGFLMHSLPSFSSTFPAPLSHLSFFPLPLLHTSPPSHPPPSHNSFNNVRTADPDEKALPPKHCCQYNGCCCCQRTSPFGWMRSTWQLPTTALIRRLVSVSINDQVKPKQNQ
jgi:hypothetical protein